jgi:hypothetical protein
MTRWEPWHHQVEGKVLPLDEGAEGACGGASRPFLIIEPILADELDAGRCSLEPCQTSGEH